MPSAPRMPSLLERLPSGSRIAVIRLRSLGDCVLTTPALALLKAHRPDLQLAVVVECRFRAVFEDNPDVAEILRPTTSAIAAWKPRLVLNLHGGTRSMALTIGSRARFRAGFAHHRYSFIYSRRIPRAQEVLGEERPVHTAEHVASAMFWLGVPRQEIPRAKLVADPAIEVPSNPYAVLHPFASQQAKTWPADRFVAVAHHLKNRCALEPIFLAGPTDDADPFAGFRVYRNAPLKEVKTLVSRSQLFIGNDSGPAHVAASFGIPEVVLFGPSDPVTWAPWRTEARVLTCAENISALQPAEVITAIESLQVCA
ncbi:MAG TPA: glycosyltransferase family 9 protein [Bryobacteraceae bacterium]|jgi:ADP-heptose:LPS heptosyltransferase